MTKTQDWTRHKIRYELAQAGFNTLYCLDDSAAFPHGTCSNAIGEPHRRGEEAIADALGKKPQDIWPSRYDAEGNRLRPQPSENYRGRPSAPSRQNAEAA